MNNKKVGREVALYMINENGSKNKILQLAKSYSKEHHLKFLPYDGDNILQSFNYLYDENWENEDAYPYEVLTYLFDSYYVLPQRPDLAALFCWQAINRLYYVRQLRMSEIGKCSDTRGIELIRKTLLDNWNRYKPILEPYLDKMSIKTFHYVASYMLKGYAMETYGITEKYRASAYNTLKKRIPAIIDIMNKSYGKSYCQIANPIIIDGTVQMGISDAEKCKSRSIIHSFAQKLRKLMLDETVEITFFSEPDRKKEYNFTKEEQLSFLLFGILYASRCNNFHGNVAARMNSINANIDTYNMYMDMYLVEYIILAICMNDLSILSDDALDRVEKNVNIMR